jgi:hypothetical protein
VIGLLLLLLPADGVCHCFLRWLQALLHWCQPDIRLLLPLQVLSVIDSEMVFGEPTYEAFKFK